MKSNYKTVQPWVLAYEGGWVNDPRDPVRTTRGAARQHRRDERRTKGNKQPAAADGG